MIDASVIADTAMMVMVLGVAALALVVDVAVIVGWLRRGRRF